MLANHFLNTIRKSWKNRRKARKTIMVGNDLQEDLSASSLGIITFLTKDGQILNGDKPKYTPDIIGKMEDLLEILPLLSK